MKVLHINTSLNGGSGKAADRLNQALNNFSSVESKILSDAHSFERNLNADKSHLTYSNGWITRKLYKLNQKFLNYTRAGNKESMSSIKSLFRVKDRSLKEASIIHLHWANGFLDIDDFIKSVDKPVVITLHDMWYFTGGCHYSNGCTKYMQTCNRCPELGSHFFGLDTKKHQSLKQNIFKDNKDRIKIVCLSKWMLEASSSSSVLSGLQHELIPNSVDTEVFNQMDQTKLRRKHNLPLDKKILFFIAGNKNNHRKGADLLNDSFSLTQEHPDLFFISAGSYKPPELNDECYRGFGHVSGDHNMAELYALSDAFVLPSREDNLPNVMLEAMACGTPVISFAQGGMKDVIIDQVNGLLCDSIDASSLKNVINEFLNQSDQYNRSNIRDFVVDNFHAKKQAQRFEELYRNLIK